MPFHWLRPKHVTYQEPGVIFNGNVPAENIVTMRSLSNEPLQEGREAFAASRVLKDGPQPTAVFYFSDRVRFTTNQMQAVAKLISQALQGLQGQAFDPTPDGGTRYPLAIGYDDVGPGKGAIYSNGTHPVAALHLPWDLWLSEEQKDAVLHELSHIVSRFLALDADPTHDKDNGVIATRKSLVSVPK